MNRDDIISVDRAVLEQALEALENGKRVRAYEGGTKCQISLEGSAITALRAALAEPVQEPVAWLQPRTFNGHFRPDLGYETCSKTDYGAFPVYTAPPQRKPLDTKQLEQIMADCFADFADKNMPPNWWHWTLRNFARAVERAHGI